MRLGVRKSVFLGDSNISGLLRYFSGFVVNRQGKQIFEPLTSLFSLFSSLSWGMGCQGLSINSTSVGLKLPSIAEPSHHSTLLLDNSCWAAQRKNYTRGVVLESVFGAKMFITWELSVISMSWLW